jgi:hypothetical protein
MQVMKAGIVCIVSASIVGCGKSAHEVCMDEVLERQEICIDTMVEQGSSNVLGCLTRALEDAARCPAE